MTTKWPRESSEQIEAYTNQSFDPIDSFNLIAARYLLDGSKAIDNSVSLIIYNKPDLAEIEQYSEEMSEDLDIQELQEADGLLLSLACAIALAKAPNLNTWKNVKVLSYNSWQLEHWLADAMLAWSAKEPNSQNAYITLALITFQALDSGNLIAKSNRNNEEREQFLNYWEENQDKLMTIWLSMYHWSETMYLDELALFKVCSSLNSSKLLKAIENSRNPALVSTALSALGTSQYFSLWQECVAALEPSFNEDGTWNGLVIMPSLLEIARRELLNISWRTPVTEITVETTARAKEEIARIAKVIVTILAERPDAMPLFARWSTALMRALLQQGSGKADDPRSSAMVDDALIEAIGRRLKGEPFIEDSPANAPAWEAWCYKCTLAAHRSNNFIDKVNVDSFLNEWRLTLDEWAGTPGQNLRSHAEFITGFSNETPSDAAYLLAYPIAQLESPLDTWLDVWNGVQFLREIIEFSDIDDDDNIKTTRYQRSTEAEKLVALIFSIGLAILDHKASNNYEIGSSDNRSLVALHSKLYDAMIEMRAIDYFLTRERWQQIFSSLATRRLLWEKDVMGARSAQDAQIFKSADTPTFSEYLYLIKDDAIELTSILSVVISYSPDMQIVREKLCAASINIDDTITSTANLTNISTRRYPLNNNQITRICDAFKIKREKL